MLDLTRLFEFSHTYCVAICAALVPLNLLATLQTLVFVGLNRSRLRVGLAAGLAGLVASAMILHVMTWFAIGVVMVQTYILLMLGGICLSVNLWAVQHPQSMRWVLSALRKSLRSLRLGTQSAS